MKELFKTIIADFHTSPLPKFHRRETEIPSNSRKIVTVVGSRRSGKTYLFYQLISDLLKSVPAKNIIYINFEDERINPAQEDLQFILEAYYELYPKGKGELYLFFDEIQNISGWEKFVRRIYDTVSKNIFLTGSTSNFLNIEVSSSLRGRAIVYELYPLSFREYLRFTGTDFSDAVSTRAKANLLSHFRKFLTAGGFPEMAVTDERLSQKILQSYFDVMIYRDIIERYSIRNITALKYFIKKSISNTANKISVNKIFNELKSLGIKLSKDSIYEYFTFAQDCFLLFLVNRYSESLTVQNVNDKKLYTIDNGLANAVSFRFSENTGRMLENSVFLELKRREKEIFYFTEKGECDFILSDRSEVVEAIQVTVMLDKNNYNREIGGLIEALKKFGLKSGTILTLDDQREIIHEGYFIKVLPVWKWALDK